MGHETVMEHFYSFIFLSNSVVFLQFSDCATSSESELTVVLPACTTAGCSCSCCSNFSIANQPKHLSQSKSYQGCQTYSRRIQASWYAKYPWITVCMSSFRIFCQTRCLAREENLVRPCSEKSNLPFLQGGFSNWKQALQRFVEHEKSDIHREASVKLVAKTSSLSITAQLHS